MKHQLLITGIVLQAVFFSSCTKSDAITSPAAPRNVNPAPTIQIPPPVVYAGADITLQLPQDSAYLYGSYSTQSRVSSILWRKISGPACQIIDATTALAKVTGLVPGVYEFEITVTDTLNQYGRDTINVSVFGRAAVTAAAGSITFTNLTWIFPWYNSLELPNIHSYVPQNVPMRVYVQRFFDTSWAEAYPVSNYPNSAYEYFIETRPDGAGMYHLGSLYIFYYGNNVSDRPNVKVTY